MMKSTRPPGPLAVAYLDAARRRRARGLKERSIHVDVVVHAPAEKLVEGRGAVEHALDARDAPDVPAANVLVERRSAFERLLHELDGHDVPATEVLVERRPTGIYQALIYLGSPAGLARARRTRARRRRRRRGGRRAEAEDREDLHRGALRGDHLTVWERSE